MNYYEVKTMEGATLGVVPSAAFRKIKNGKLLCSKTKEESQYIMVGNQLYRPISFLRNPEPEEFKNKYPQVKIYNISLEDYRAYKQAELEEEIAKSKLD